MSEHLYAIRRTDGETIGDDWEMVTCAGPDDWTLAADMTDPDEDPVEYEIVRLLVEPVGRRTYPQEAQ